MDYKDNNYNYRCYDYQEGFLKGCEDCYDLFRKNYFEYCLIPEYVPNTEDLGSEAKYYRIGYIYGYYYAREVLTKIGYFPNSSKEASINELIDEIIYENEIIDQVINQLEYHTIKNKVIKLPF